MSIKVKFILGFLLCIVVSASTVAGIAFWKMNDVNQTTLQQSALSQLHLTNIYLRNFFTTELEKLQSVTKNPIVPETLGQYPNYTQSTEEREYEVDRLSPKAALVREMLMLMHKSSPNIGEVFIAFPDGSYVSSIINRLPPGFDVRTRPWYQRALSAPTDTRIGEAYRSLTGELVVPITVRLKDASGTVYGVAGADINLATIDDLFSQMNFGKTGYFVLVDKAEKLLCTPKRKELLLKPLTEMAPHLQALFQKGSGSVTINHFGKDNIVNVTTTIDNWRLFSFIEQQEVSAASRGAMNLILYCTIGIIALLLGFAYLFAQSICKPISLIMLASQDVLKGDISRIPPDSAFSGELLSLHLNLKVMVEQLFAAKERAAEDAKEAQRQTEAAKTATEEAEQARAAAEDAQRQGILKAAQHLESVVDIIGTSSSQLSSHIQKANTIASSSAHSLTEAATAMNEMNATVHEVAHSASTASRISSEAKQEALSGADIMTRSLQHIHKVHEDSLALKDSMAQLNDHTQAISQIMGVISDIADQTNLLALNAAIEAARAGEAGRGFAVVADEVRKLAEKTVSSAADVGKAIRAIQQSAYENISSVDSSVDLIQETTELANQAGEALQKILSSIEITADQVNAIATASEEQSAASEEINRTISNVSTLSEQTSEGMNEATTVLNSLVSQSQTLHNLIEEMLTNNKKA